MRMRLKQFVQSKTVLVTALILCVLVGAYCFAPGGASAENADRSVEAGQSDAVAMGDAHETSSEGASLVSANADGGADGDALPGGTAQNLDKTGPYGAAGRSSGTDKNAGAGTQGSGGGDKAPGAGVSQGSDGNVPNPPPRADDGSETEKTLSVTLRIDCLTILNNRSLLRQGKERLVPADGVIMGERRALFTEGETVFDVLKRETRAGGILMEFSTSPVYGSAYIEGINNLYEFDCGDLSGWMYSVNGWYPNYGCSQYTLKDGDAIRWSYTCDLGADLGASGSLNGRQ
ncbi:MAG: DUF4430 domain-containing protein [Clostridiales Family XIII bacterium]|nr:DUF4430 domain-containing protein [Clostridiales Family XIII bacterium]